MKITSVSGKAVPLLIDEVDTDRIIPARFLRFVSFDGLGPHVFEDDRQQNPDHPFDAPQYQGGSVLISGDNFGCGSSREHAPQALKRWGIDGIVAGSFAEIFFSNCLALGIPAVTAEQPVREALAAAAERGDEVTLDVERREIRVGSETYGCEIPESARVALIEGAWDVLGSLVENPDDVKAIAARLPYMNDYPA